MCVILVSIRASIAGLMTTAQYVKSQSFISQHLTTAKRPGKRYFARLRTSRSHFSSHSLTTTLPCCTMKSSALHLIKQQGF